MTANAKNVKRIVLIYANSGKGIGTYKLQHVREPFLRAPLSVASLADPFDSQLACQPYCIDTTYRHRMRIRVGQSALICGMPALHPWGPVRPL